MEFQRVESVFMNPGEFSQHCLKVLIFQKMLCFVHQICVMMCW